jgi:Arc/MetJ-type ribon-helix-helix transcriptional regulator
MRERKTRRTDPDQLGRTVNITARLSEAQVEAVDSAVDSGIPGIRTRTDAIQDALSLWLTELDWLTRVPASRPS